MHYYFNFTDLLLKKAQLSITAILRQFPSTLLLYKKCKQHLLFLDTGYLPATILNLLNLFFQKTINTLFWFSRTLLQSCVSVPTCSVIINDFQRNFRKYIMVLNRQQVTESFFGREFYHVFFFKKHQTFTTKSVSVSLTLTFWEFNFKSGRFTFRAQAMCVGLYILA